MLAISLNISYVNATRITFFIPFDGEAPLFKCKPSTYTHSHPTGSVEDGQLLLSYMRTDHDESTTRAAFDRDLAQVRQWLTWVNTEVSIHNASVPGNAQGRIEMRRQKLLKDRGLAASLGFPLKRREDAPQTYVAPTVRKKAPVSQPPAGTSLFAPEPALAMDEYEHVLSVISNMVDVMERSPHAFQHMEEEDLRQHFLVQLNGQYEGQATGETFNFEGKTDILIRVDGKNIFIAECKFWEGPKRFQDALNQLLGYTMWRDTKTALLLFNRTKNLSAVLAKMPEEVLAHPCFKRTLPYDAERGRRFILHHPDDANRELILTVLVFEVPR